MKGGIMIREWGAVITLVAVAGLVSGCASQVPPVVDNSALVTENNSLKQRVFDLEGEKTLLRNELVGARGDVAGARLDADQWKSRYEAAKSALPTSTPGGLPPELMRKFIEIAQAGGPFELGPAGNLKASSDILFDSGKIALKPTGIAALREIAPKLREILTDTRVMLRVDGHTDNQAIKRSGWDDNLHLSLMRARAVVVYLATQGVPSNAMCAAGFGEWHPVAENLTKAGMSKNRRVELSLMSSGQTGPATAPMMEPEMPTPETKTPAAPAPMEPMD
jgi:outer membrane protein OmpA-like peptidoglycan-associated protein